MLAVKLYIHRTQWLDLRTGYVCGILVSLPLPLPIADGRDYIVIIIIKTGKQFGLLMNEKNFIANWNSVDDSGYSTTSVKV